MICWSLWRARNEVMSKQKRSTTAFIVQSTRIALDQYKFAQSRKVDFGLSNFQDDKVDEHWTAPVENQIKINIDGAIFEHEGRFGIGFLARGNGKLIEA